MDNKVISFLHSYFTASSWYGSIFEWFLLLFTVFISIKFFLFLLRYFIIYYLVRKLNISWQKFKYKKKFAKPTNREDEKLRDKEFEKKKEKEATQDEQEFFIEAEDFKIIMPKAIGKWQKQILGQRQNMVFEIAKRMQTSNSKNFWQTFVEVRNNQQSRGVGRSRGFDM